MPKSRSTTITLPTERAVQLRAIALAHGLSLTELLCKLIESEIKAGVITDDVPGFRLEKVGGIIEFQVQKKTIRLTFQEADAIACALEQDDPDYWHTTNRDKLHLKIRRQGRGLAFRFCEEDAMRAWSRKGLSASTIPWVRQGLSLATALDLARLFRNTLKPQASGLP